MQSNAVQTMSDTQPVVVDPVVSMIERVALDPNVDISKLEKMLEMKERMDAHKAKEAFAAAFAAASANFPTIPLNGKGHNNKPYALLKDILSATRPVLSEFGLALNFSIDSGEAIIVTAKLMHKEGHSETTSITLPRDASGSKNAVQAVGSSQTYGQRYTAQAILGLSLGDDMEDDGRGAGAPPSQPPAPRDPWTHTIISEMPDGATGRDKAMAIAQALCAQFKRMKGARQLSNEWDRRAHLIEGDKGLEGQHPDLHETVFDAYENRKMEIEGNYA